MDSAICRRSCFFATFKSHLPFIRPNNKAKTGLKNSLFVAQRSSKRRNSALRLREQSVCCLGLAGLNVCPLREHRLYCWDSDYRCVRRCCWIPRADAPGCSGHLNPGRRVLILFVNIIKTPANQISGAR